MPGSERYATLALDHRDAMRNAFRRAGVEDVGADEILDTKRRIVAALAPLATAVLLDAETARRCRPAGLDLLVPLEGQGHVPLEGGRLNTLMDDFTATDAVELGAEGCKLLLYYRADHAPTAERQRRLVGRAAADCHARGLRLFVEPLVYRLEDEGEADFRAAFADHVVAGARDLAVSGADVLKLQYPGDGGCERLTEAAAPLPWALLGGNEVGADEFARQLGVACRAGAGGFIAGRAIWGGALGRPPAEQDRWLHDVAVPLFERLSAIAGSRL
jgi:tagatose-1,6-bisphosphate aldolase